MTEIFTHTDEDGDRMRVCSLAPSRARCAQVYLDRDDETISVYLTPAAVDLLCEALTPYRTPTAGGVRVGGEYRLLPNPRCTLSDGTGLLPSAVVCAATRVRVEHGPDRVGDYLVTALDGAHSGGDGFVHGRYLVPLETVATDEAVGVLRDALTRSAPVEAAGLDPARVAALREAFAILGEDGATVDAETLLECAGFLIGDDV